MQIIPFFYRFLYIKIRRIHLPKSYNYSDSFIILKYFISKLKFYSIKLDFVKIYIIFTSSFRMNKFIIRNKIELEENSKIRIKCWQSPVNRI